MRLFLGVKVESQIAEEIYKWGTDVNLPGKRVAPENLHFTLYFIGDVFKSPVEVTRYMDEAFEGEKPFNLTLKGLGAFFSKGKPRVLFIKIDKGYKELCNLEEIITTLPFYKRDKPFKPHLTLSRLKEGSRKDDVDRLLDQYKDHDFGSFQVDKVILFSSDLRPSGPVYKAEAEWTLG